MTPKEKAENIYKLMLSKIEQRITGYDEIVGHEEAAIECALICVEELIELNNGWMQSEFTTDEAYFKEVKKELEKL